MRRRYQAVIILIVLFASLVLVLRGAVPQNNATQIEGTSHLQSIDGTTLGPEIWSDNLTAQSRWQVYPDKGTTGYISYSNNSLNLTAYFPAAPYPQAVSIYRRSINVSLNNEPISIATVNATRGIHYGERLSGLEPGNVTFNAWYESDPFQHRLGQGTNENLTTNLPLNSYLANGHLPPTDSNITSIKLYIEATPGQSGWFSLILSHIAILTTQREPYVNGGTYNGLMVRLNSAFDASSPTDQSLLQIYAGYRIGGTPNLQYRLFFLKGLNVEAEGYVYHLKSISDYEEADLVPQNVHDFPSVYSDSNESYISVVPLQGSINYFQLDTLTFQYLPQTVAVSGYVDPNFAQFLYSYYIVFLFVLPIVMTLLFTGAFKNETASDQETTGNP